MSFYGRFFRSARAVAKGFFVIGESPAPNPALEPCVYICRHKNMQGPLYTMVNLKTPVRPWVLDVFCTEESCFRHYRDYTFTQRYGWPRWQATIVAKLASRIIPPLIRSLRGIPVYRGSAKITSTYRQSIAALKNNECIIIYPDVDYTDTSNDSPELYQGYLLLDRLYRRERGRALPFVPLYVDAENGRIVQGEAIYFSSAADDQQAETRRVGEAIKEALVAFTQPEERKERAKAIESD